MKNSRTQTISFDADVIVVYVKCYCQGIHKKAMVVVGRLCDKQTLRHTELTLLVAKFWTRGVNLNFDCWPHRQNGLLDGGKWQKVKSPIKTRNSLKTAERENSSAIYACFSSVPYPMVELPH